MGARDGWIWWKHGVLYQAYPRSFQDSDGDGVGDLDGVIRRLDHLAWLGIDGIWLNPIHPSPNRDWGYDVADYDDVAPEFGGVGALDRLVDAASSRGIRVLLDLVPNHTSDRHPWFVDARRGRDAEHRDWYVWADPAPGGGSPNNWKSTFGGGRRGRWTQRRASTTCTTSCRGSPTSTGGTRTCARVRCDPAGLVRSRRRRVPDRRGARHHQGRSAA